VSVAAVLSFASIQKAIDPAQTARVPTFVGLSHEAAAIAVWASVMVEVFVAGWLLSGFRPGVASVVAIVLLLAYTGFLVFLVAQSDAPACGCLRVLSQWHSARTENLLGVGRNTGLVALLIASLRPASSRSTTG
jgi:hypothetical protein